MAKTKTQSEFVKEINELSKGTFTVNSKYINSHISVNIIHNVCGQPFEMTPTNFLTFLKTKDFTKCKNCKDTTRHSTLDRRTTGFLDRLNKMHGEGTLTLLSDYRGMREDIKLRNNNCKHEFEMLAANVFKLSTKTSCTKCNPSKGRKVIMQERLLDSVLNDYDNGLFD